MTTNTMDREFVSLLRRRQIAEGWNDSQMARELGISRALWGLTRVGRKPVGRSLLRAVSRRFPELSPDVTDYLRADFSGRLPTLVPSSEEVQ